MSEAATQYDNARYQADRLGLRNVDSLRLYLLYMSEPVNKWPETLKAHVDAKQKELGLCGEVISTAIVEWLNLDYKQRPGDQPLPTKNDNPSIQDLVIADMEARKAIGISRYGTTLKAHNGRDALLDAYQEALDLCNYLRQVMYERDGK